MKLTALQQLLERATIANNSAYRHEMKDIETPTKQQVELYGRNKGKQVAYSEAYFLMKAELTRLQLLLQNGSLTPEDFNI